MTTPGGHCFVIEVEANKLWEYPDDFFHDLISVFVSRKVDALARVLTRCGPMNRVDKCVGCLVWFSD